MKDQKNSLFRPKCLDFCYIRPSWTIRCREWHKNKSKGSGPPSPGNVQVISWSCAGTTGKCVKMSLCLQHCTKTTATPPSPHTNEPTATRLTIRTSQLQICRNAIRVIIIAQQPSLNRSFTPFTHTQICGTAAAWSYSYVMGFVQIRSNFHIENRIAIYEEGMSFLLLLLLLTSPAD